MPVSRTISFRCIKEVIILLKSIKVPPRPYISPSGRRELVGNGKFNSDYIRCLDELKAMNLIGFLEC